MSLKDAKQHLIQLLKDKEHKVIALSGRWGTGKSHLWREVQQEASESVVRNAIYVSLFGLSDMNQLKFKAVQSAIPQAEGQEKIRTALKGARKLLETLHKGFSALDEVALLAVPSILSGKVIVLDDIERKHDKLSIEEILGFIDDFTQQNNSRFVLILNDDQLANRSVWDTLREKVIDQEIRLLTTAEEAFGIALKLTPSNYSEWIEKAISTCGVNNIRIICKVIRAVNRVIGDRQLNGAVLARIIPSIVLLTAIHYKGIDDGPNFEFVLAAGDEGEWEKFMEKDNNTQNDKGETQKAKWNMLLKELDIYGCDEFEVLVVDFLETGQFETNKVSKIIDRYSNESNELKARQSALEFMHSLWWDHRLSESDLVKQAGKLIPDAIHIDPYFVSELYSELESLPNGQAIGIQMIEKWIAHVRQQQGKDIDSHSFGRKLHPDIESALEDMKINAQKKSTIFDVCKYIRENKGWNTSHEMTMKTASADDFESTIRDLEIDHFKLFMRTMLDMRNHRANYDRHFGTATDHFVEACQNIVTNPKAGRLGSVIKRLFKNANLVHEVE